MPSTHVDLISHWRIPVPVDRVWDALTDPASWPQWWPLMREVQTLRAGGAGGLGGVHRIRWATRLLHELVIDVHAVEALRHERLRARSSGQLHGEGIWLLRASGDLTEVTCVWRVELTRPWMRWLRPLLAPLLRWHHTGVMRVGEAGLTRHLSGAAPAPGPRR